MAMVINSNIASLTSQRHLSQSRNDMEVAMERMSSGRRINSSMDDAAGLAIGNRMTSQIEGLNQAIRNANDGISLAQTAESALDSHSGILQRIRVLAVQSANDTYSTLDRKTLNNEIVQLKEELNRSVSEAAFNGQKILDGSSTNFTFQIGHTAQDTVDISLSNMSGSQIGTQTWADKAGVIAPTTTEDISGVTKLGTIAGAASGSSPVAGNIGTSVPAAISVVLNEGSAKGDIASITVGSTTFSHTFLADTASASLAADAYVEAWNADSTAGAAFIATNISGTLTFTAPTVVDAWADKAGVTAPTTALTVPATPEVLATVTMTISGDSIESTDTMTMTAGSATFAHTFTADATPTVAADSYVAAWNASADPDVSLYTASNVAGAITITEDTATAGDLTVAGSVAQVGGTSNITATTAATGDTGVVGVAEQESYDFTGITLATGDRLTLTIGSETYSQEFATDQETTLNALGALVVSGEAGYVSEGVASGALVFVGNADGTAMAAATMAIETATVLAASATYTPHTSAITVEQESYDFSDITLATGDRLTLTIGSETYIQEYATDQETTLNALGALVVNGETGYVSKGVVNGALVFVGNADGTAIAAATMAVETATVTAANSIDDVLVTDSVSAKHALTVVDNALEMMADFRSRMGAVSNRMFHTIDNLMSVSENTSAARSRIVDADFALESASLAKSQILQKAGTAMLSQANASTQDILSLLK
jgi:flagellin